MRIDEAINNLRTKVEGVSAGVAAAWDAFKGGTGMIPKEEQTIGNLKYAIRMNQEEMEPNEINFVDFNGMVLSMTIEEVMQLTEMPQPNEYYNLTFEHWTKTLEEIQDGRCHTVGATYHTTDGLSYYVVEVADGESILMKTQDDNGFIYWGDGTRDAGSWSNTHTYEKGGTYIVYYDRPLTRCIVDIETPYIKEVYFGENVVADIRFRYSENLKKISIPDSGITNNVVGSYGFSACGKLTSLVLGNSQTGSIDYNALNHKELKYLVADGITSIRLASMASLKCFSLKSVKSITNIKGYSNYPKLEYIIFDSVETIASNVFTISGGSYDADYQPCLVRIIDLPESVVSIANTTFKVNCSHIYIRSLVVPTLGGNNVFKKNNNQVGVVFHIRKDATYTDAEGTTYTGLEAYSNATNWASIYANTKFTFIDDL